VRFGIEREGRLIGGVGYYRRPSGVAELGFWLGRSWWGHGYATEASRAVLRHGFANPRLPAFSSAHFTDNPASARVLVKLGFEPTGRGRIACAARQQDVEVVTYWLDRQGVLMGEPARGSQAARQPARWRVWLGLFGGA
jgi:RimJ/RimL family protein N-acetyltransferase